MYNIEMGRACSQNGLRRGTFKILTGKPTGKWLGVDGRTILEWTLKR